MSAFMDPAHRPLLDPFAAPKQPAQVESLPPYIPQTYGMSAAPAMHDTGSATTGSQPGAVPESEHPWLSRVGRDLGLGLGIGVTELLALAPSWNQPVLDAKGAPAASVPGAERIGDHDILKRHQEVVGPQLTTLDNKIQPGALHDFVGGLASGATQAPGESYRLESYLADLLHGGKSDR